MDYLRRSRAAPGATQTAVIAAVPVADAVVGDHREHLDAAASWGVPAHVTVLYPFVAPDHIDEQLIATLAAAVRTVDAFTCRLGRTGWFGHDVLWLDPDPAQPFRDLTAVVGSAFPDHLPYGGVHADIVPHLTVGERRSGSLQALRDAERGVTTGLPLTARIDQVLLVAGSQAPASWHTLHVLPLAATRGRTA